MPYTWLQLQWLKNNSTLDFTQKYEVFRLSAPGVDEFATKIAEVPHSQENTVYMVISDTPDNKSADDPEKIYYGPQPYDYMGPAKVDGLNLIGSNSLNNATLSWNVPNDLAAHWYYRVRGVDDGGHPSDLSHEFSATLQADLHETPYHLQRSTNGIDWEDVGYLSNNIYVEENIDIEGPNAVTSAIGTPSTPSEGVGQITVKWNNSSQDNGTDSYYYRVRARDNASELFPGHPDNFSEMTELDRTDRFSDTQSPVNVAVGVTDGVGGVEVRYRNAKQPGPQELVTFDSNTKFIGRTRVVVGSVEVRPNGGGIPFTESADYEVDYPSGLITRLPSGNIPAGGSVTVDYFYNDGVRPTDDDPVLGPFDGTYFVNGYGGLESYDHTGLTDRDCYNYRIRVRDNVGNWSAAVDLIVNIDDATPPPPPQNFSIVAFSA